MKLNAIGVFADTARSKAYAQALVHNGFNLKKVLFLGKTDGGIKGKPASGSIEHNDFNGKEKLFQTDFSVPLLKTLHALSDTVVELSTGTVNHPDVIENLITPAADIAIYSGFGGEIVSSRVLDSSPPMLHMHSGYLPSYRGSTTVYYSILEEQKCAVSAIFLSKKIDTGDILKRIWYPKPKSGTDIDYIYDTAIRAATLIQVLQSWVEKGEFEISSVQTDKEGETYYVIHPVLKHLAILSLEGKE